ncbi:alpha/beta-hydrolase [Guyanagaster necrorhizus]|uniref:Alpha/beta-hydrolase n=1 Tax=Guyanagaster necrorhizus TaxID=856835 RepID=A0A9P7VXG9_9AGAR|nr:alpha/beta-hydrolase [Guyanagaster necrorhizus MCA 3950]KAG7449341.1 alpha/beta-hydrolase [Guyanagaster necrorhizus MCA 3950]
MIYVQDKRLPLSGGRSLAYADNGNTSSSTLILFLHGAFSVGDASRLSPILVGKNIHFIAPSLPGWGKSSPVSDPSNYSTTLASDMSTLLAHLRTDALHLKIIICGYSFGTVAAQMLYGAPASVFPFRSQISSLVLLAPHTPPHCHMDYAKDMSWQSYFLTGPPCRYIPFNIPARLSRYALVAKLKSVSAAEIFIRRSLFDRMTDRERESYLHWKEDHGLGEGQFEREMAANMLRSVGQTWEGFLQIPTIYHSGWGGLSPSTLVKGRKDGFSPPVYIVAAKRDHTVSLNAARWLAGQYPNASLKVVDGSHISLLLHLDDIWKEILD